MFQKELLQYMLLLSYDDTDTDFSDNSVWLYSANEQQVLNRHARFTIDKRKRGENE